MTIHQAKNLGMVDYLSSVGYEPSRISGKTYWYPSPLHDEKTASFKVNRHLNRWHDFTEGRGGNVVDFGTMFYKCSVSDFLEKLGTPAIQIHQHPTGKIIPIPEHQNNNQIKSISVQDVQYYPLMKYLDSRRIEREIPNQFIKEIHYKIADKNYYALDFKNDSVGYELRNECFKGSSSPKDLTFVDNGSRELAVFEGFFNFLSYMNLYYKQVEPLRNFLILNSASFFEKT